MTTPTTYPIPSTAHFLWIGDHLPFAYQLALRSAARNGGFDRVVLHHQPALAGSRDLRFAAASSNLETRCIDDGIFDATPHPVAMRALYRSLAQPAARVNVLRVALLHGEGGVYLDTDTLTLRTFEPLRRTSELFCGEETIIYPAHVRSSSSPYVQGLAAGRSLIRSACRQLPRGHRVFARLAPGYPRAVNNAVLGARPGHPFLASLMEAMLAKPEAARHVRYALGTHLLQETVRRRPGDVDVLSPETFYPLGPEISTHWFRTNQRVRLEEVVTEATVSVHWYASVRTRNVVPRISPRYLAAHRSSQLFSALVAAHLPEALDLTSDPTEATPSPSRWPGIRLAARAARSAISGP